jgi:hypothetical protein
MREQYRHHTGREPSDSMDIKTMTKAVALHKARKELGAKGGRKKKKDT